MDLRKSIAVFAAKFLFCYGVLAACWPLCRWDYALLLREHGKNVYRALQAQDFVGIHPESRKDFNDTMLSLRMSADGPALEVVFSSWLIGFHPTILLMALILATPVDWYRRLWAILIGSTVVVAFISVRLVAILALAPLARLPDNLLCNAARWLVFDFTHGPAVSSFVSVVIWVAVMFRREDLARLLDPARYVLVRSSPEPIAANARS